MVSSVTDQSTFGPVETISDTVSACAQVRPSKENELHQPNHVQQTLGEEGANLSSSPQMKDFGDGYRLEVLTSVTLPSISLREVKAITESPADLSCVS